MQNENPTMLLSWGEVWWDGSESSDTLRGERGAHPESLRDRSRTEAPSV